MRLREAIVQDAAPLAAFATRAFWDTYRDIDEPADIASYVSEHFTADALSTVIGDPTSTTLLAEIGAQLVGYAQLRIGEPPACVSGPAPIELARLYLSSELIGRGYGSTLMLAVQAKAKSLGGQTLWLGVYDRNVRAVRFYERFGFTNVGGKEFLFGGHVYVDPIYSVRLSRAA
jgi:ribosomal protein S18 acetylase RimI-like enzyme